MSPELALPAQASLEGMPEAPRAPDALLKVVMSGRLEMRRVRTTDRGAVHIEALVRQHVSRHPHALPLWVDYLVPDHGLSFASTHQHALDRLATLHEGEEVVVLGRGLEVGRHEGEQVLQFLHVDGIARADAVRHATPKE